MADIVTSSSVEEAKQIIAECDAAFRNHANSSLELGRALLRVKDSRAYLFTHKTLEAFAQEKYDIERRRVQLLIRGIQIIEETKAHNCAHAAGPDAHHGAPNLPNITDVITNEGQARALADVPVEKRGEVLESIVGSGMQVTAKSIEVAAAAIAGNEKHKPKSEPKKNSKLLGHVQEAFNLGYQFDAIISDLIMAVDKAKHLKAKSVGEFIQIERFASIIENAKAQIAFAKPWADCVPCQQKGCKLCHKRGWLPRELFKTLTDDLRALSVIKGKRAE